MSASAGRLAWVRVVGADYGVYYVISVTGHPRDRVLPTWWVVMSDGSSDVGVDE